MILNRLACCRQSQHHDEEKRALSREIIVLNNHLMEAKLTVEKLREDNVSKGKRLVHLVKIVARVPVLIGCKS